MAEGPYLHHPLRSDILVIKHQSFLIWPKSEATLALPLSIRQEKADELRERRLCERGGGVGGWHFLVFQSNP